MKKALSMFVLVAVAICVSAGAAIAADAATAAVSPAAVVEWVAVHKAAVFGAALGVSELLALIPGLKGNGILDLFIKVLKRLAGKETA